jgi:hypothetical protein
MTTNLETQTDEERRYLYTGVAIVLAVLVAVGLFTLKAGATTQAAEDKAAQLITELESAGVSAPSSQVLVRLLGDDGGAVCEDPNGHPAGPDDDGDGRSGATTHHRRRSGRPG